MSEDEEDDSSGEEVMMFTLLQYWVKDEEVKQVALDVWKYRQKRLYSYNALLLLLSDKHLIDMLISLDKVFAGLTQKMGFPFHGPSSELGVLTGIESLHFSKLNLFLHIC
jgi:hypothetical protein